MSVHIPEEQVLVIETSLLKWHAKGLIGFSSTVLGVLECLLDPTQMKLMPRSEAENDPNYRQLIPYILIRCGDQLFQYARAKSGGESRLHDKLSLGVGGHINQDDARTDNLPDTAGVRVAGHLRWNGASEGYRDMLDRRVSSNMYYAGMFRELTEEVDIKSEYSLNIVGMVNDESTPVGRVHLGVVHLLTMTKPDFEVKDKDLADGKLRPIDEIMGDIDRFEGWSQLCLRARDEWWR